MDVLLELTYGLGAEGVRNSFTFSRVLCAVPRVEEPAADGDEGVVVLAKNYLEIAIREEKGEREQHRGLRGQKIAYLQN